MSNNDSVKMMQQYEQKSYTFDMFDEKIKAVNQNILNKFNPKKIQQYCEKPLDTRKREIIKNLCSNLHEKLGGIFQREINKILDEQKIQDNFKILDYLLCRDKILREIGKDSEEVFDEEEKQLDDLKEFLAEFYNKM